MKSDEPWIVIVTIVAVVFSISGFIAGHGAGAAAARQQLYREAVEYGHAEYSTKTGQWQWKAVEVPAPVMAESQ